MGSTILVDPLLSRRTLLTYLASTLCSVSAVRQIAFAASAPALDFRGDKVFRRIVGRAKAKNWASLPIGELIGNIAREFEGTPYVAKTLERSSDTEICSANLLGLDCVTFFETSLAMARMLKKGRGEPADLLAEIQFIRYRNGVLGDFTSRLHYMSDWLVDNQKKGVVRLLTELPGAEAIKLNVSVMSVHPEFYPQLSAHPDLIEKIKKQEALIDTYTLSYIPVPKLAAIEGQLKTGDIVALCTSRPGEDFSHTGLIYVTPDGVRHFMDASSRKENMKVTLEPGPISERMSLAKNVIGVVFARPLEPS